MRAISSKADGVDTLPAGDFNANLGLKELNNYVTDTGQTLDPEGGPDTKEHQMGIAAAIYAADGGYYQDGGAANAYTLTKIVATMQVPNAYFNGMEITFIPANTNTGACTINVGGIGVKNLTDIGGVALAAGRIVAGQYVTARYDGTQFVLISNPAFAPGSLKLLDTDLSHYGILNLESDLSANRTIAIKGGDKNFVLLTGDVGTITVFGQNAAPTGWTKKTDWQNNAMFCYSTGNINGGGAVNPQSAHKHGGGTLQFKIGELEGAGSPLTHKVYLYNKSGTKREILAQDNDISSTIGSRVSAYSNPPADEDAWSVEGQTDGESGNNNAPYYQELIAATKD